LRTGRPMSLSWRVMIWTLSMKVDTGSFISWWRE
jgi:hypothetical protein